LRIKLTKHASSKIAERNISLDTIREVVTDPDQEEMDRFDDSLVHFIGRVENRFLRVIGRWEGEGEFVVVSAFFDRRLKKGDK